jgi:hypothetical protein
MIPITSSSSTSEKPARDRRAISGLNIQFPFRSNSERWAIGRSESPHICPGVSEVVLLHQRIRLRQGRFTACLTTTCMQREVGSTNVCRAGGDRRGQVGLNDYSSEGSSNRDKFDAADKRALFVAEVARLPSSASSKARKSGDFRYECAFFLSATSDFVPEITRRQVPSVHVVIRSDRFFNCIRAQERL